LIQNPGILVTIFAFMLVLGPLVFLHELGHYLAGRWFGVKAEEFSIGFGREVAGFTDRRGTRWKFGWLPLGGYVRFAGDMNPASQPSPEWLSLPAQERARTFQAKPLWQRAIIVAAGPIMNFLIAIAILGGFAYVNGQPVTPPVIGSVLENGVAAKAGLQVGDRITAIDGRRINDFFDIAEFTMIRAGETVSIEYQRGGQTQRISATIGSQTLKDRFGNVTHRGVLGIGRSDTVLKPVALWEAPGVGLSETVRTMRNMIEGLQRIILGRIPVTELGGPIKIAKISGEFLAMGPVEFVYLIALISINLGFINLLPVPVLDGGHLLFYAVEAVRRRPVEPRVMEWAYRGGLVAILALMLFVTFNDLGAFGVWRSLAGLIG
jgi:regulator of sigma E protease